MPQAEALDAMLAERGTPLDVVAGARRADDDELYRRLAGRGRPDDDAGDHPRAAASSTMQQTAPLLDYYRGRGMLRTIDGTGHAGRGLRANRRSCEQRCSRE